MPRVFALESIENIPQNLEVIFKNVGEDPLLISILALPSFLKFKGSESVFIFYFFNFNFFYLYNTNYISKLIYIYIYICFNNMV